MVSDSRTDQTISTGSTRPTGRILLGLVLLLPALLCCATELLIPTLRTFWLSLREVNLPGAGGEFVGLENYTFLLGEDAFRRALGFTLLFLVIRLIVVAVVPPLLAWAAGRFGAPVRLGVRILLTLPVALFVPIAIAITWVLVLRPVTGLFPLDTPLLARPTTARATLLLIDALYTFGLASGLGLILYLPLWRRPGDAPPPTFRENRKPLLVTWGVGILAVIALTLGTFTLSFATTSGGPANSTITLGLLLYRLGFGYFRFGPAASLASVILLVTLLAGVGAGLLMILNRLRLSTVGAFPSPERENEQPGPPESEEGERGTGNTGSKVLPAIVLALTLLLTLGACSCSALPFGWLVPQALGEDGFARLVEQIPVGRVLANTFVLPVVTAGVQLSVVYLAALSIGALRPLGKRSDWLLLAFSPWLFVTLLPLSLVNFVTARELGIFNTYVGLVSPILFSVPGLFVLTLLFKGQSPRWKRASGDDQSSKAGAFFKHLILPSLPLAGVLLALMLFSGWQDMLWPLIVSVDKQYHPLGAVLLYLRGRFDASNELIAAGITLLILPVSAFCFVALALLQIYLDRLVLYTDDRLPSSSDDGQEGEWDNGSSSTTAR